MTKEKEKEFPECSYMGCYAYAVYKGAATQKDIDKIDRENRNKHLFKAGSWSYCQKHKDIIKGYCPHLKFENL